MVADRRFQTIFSEWHFVRGALAGGAPARPEERTAREFGALHVLVDGLGGGIMCPALASFRASAAWPLAAT
jgi:hypothetical protein